MLLTISTTHQPVTDLGFLLMKHPDNVHMTDLPFGRATIFYPEAADERCTAALTLEVDPVELVRGKGMSAGLQDQYVNDRPYAASSLLSVAMGRALSTAMSGRSKHRQELADTPIPVETRVVPLPARGGGARLIERLFQPLGYDVYAEAIEMDPAHPEWGNSSYLELRLTGHARIADLLNHLFVLIPVLDNSKHYFIGEDEVAIRYYGLLAGTKRKDSIALARKLLAVAPPPEDNALKEPPDTRPPCPCCGGHMIVIETFTRWQQPRAPPSATPPIRELAP